MTTTVRVAGFSAPSPGFTAGRPVSLLAGAAHRLIPLSTASCSIASSSSCEISRLSSTARLSSSCLTLLAPISTEVTRSSRSTQASASWASDWPRAWAISLSRRMCASASSVSSEGSSDLPWAARESSGMPSR